MKPFQRLLLGVVVGCISLVFAAILLGGLSRTTIITSYHRVEALASTVFVLDTARDARLTLAGMSCFKRHLPAYFAALYDGIKDSSMLARMHTYSRLDADAATVVRRLTCLPTRD